MIWSTTRTALRRLLNAPKFIRQYSHTGTPEEMERIANKWKNITFFVCFPTIIVCSIHVYLAEMEHLSHPRPEFKKYDHMYFRLKPFPWGDGNHGLFHNPIYNALPEGYEAPGN